MKVKDLLEVYPLFISDMKIKNAINDQIICRSRSQLEKFSELEIVRIYNKIEVLSDGASARACLYVSVKVIK